MDLESLIEMLQNPGDDGVPETIYDDLRSVHNTAIESSQTVIAEKDSVIEQQLAEINSLKASNWDLYTQVHKTGEDETTDNVDSDTIEGEDLTLDDLLEEDN